MVERLVLTLKPRLDFVDVANDQGGKHPTSVARGHALIKEGLDLSGRRPIDEGTHEVSHEHLFGGRDLGLLDSNTSLEDLDVVGELAKSSLDGVVLVGRYFAALRFGVQLGGQGGNFGPGLSNALGAGPRRQANWGDGPEHNQCRDDYGATAWGECH